MPIQSAFAYNPQVLSFNAGIGIAPESIGLVKGIVLIPKGRILTQTEHDTLLSLPDGTPGVIPMAVLNSLPATRFFSIGPFAGLKDTSGAIINDTTDYGYEIYVRDGLLNWTFRVVRGAYNMYQVLRQYQNAHNVFDALLVTDTRIYGTMSNGKYAGIRLSLIEVPTIKLPDGKTAEQQEIMLQVGDVIQMQNLWGVPISGSSSVLEIGITNVNLPATAGTNATPAGSVNIALLEATSGANLAAIYGASLASAALWTATNTVTGITIPILSVAASPSGAGLVPTSYLVQVDTTSTAYPAVAGTFRVGLVNVPALYTVGVIGYEAQNATIVTRTT